MYTFHLWINLFETEEQEERGGLNSYHKKIEKLQLLVAERLPTIKPKCCISEINCFYVFQCSCSRNHFYEEHEQLMTILNWITEHLSESHGLVYWNNDEDENHNNANSFQIIKIARGVISESTDTLLSPIRPTLEG